MKRVDKGIFFKIFQLLTGVFTLLYSFTYILIKNYLQELSLTYNLEESLLVSQLNAIFIFIGILIVILLLLSFFYMKKLQGELEEDIKSLQRYVVDISENKNYEAVLEIKHYMEFLSISVTLKNIVKRLRQKEKKALKK